VDTRPKTRPSISRGTARWISVSAATFSRPFAEAPDRLGDKDDGDQRSEAGRDRADPARQPGDDEEAGYGQRGSSDRKADGRGDHADAEGGGNEPEGEWSATEGLADQEDERYVVHGREGHPQEQNDHERSDHARAPRESQTLLPHGEEASRRLLRHDPESRQTDEQGGREGERHRVERQGSAYADGGDESAADERPKGDLQIERRAHPGVRLEDVVRVDESRDRASASGGKERVEDRGSGDEYEQDSERRLEGCDGDEDRGVAKIA